MDIKTILAMNAVATRYRTAPLPESPQPKQGLLTFDEGIYSIGHEQASFAFDNESPCHKSYVYPFALEQALVTNARYFEFVRDGGYSKAEYWLSAGWDWVQRTRAELPLYWRNCDHEWQEYTLHGTRPLDLNAPLVHVNYFEADAFARWNGKRLPTEQEFEIFLKSQPAVTEAPFGHDHPIDANSPRGQVWCWTKSAYAAYPGYRPYPGALAEYNGKFMCNQFVLRGGCVATPHGHYRDTYRNFYLPEQRWMFSGIRLAEDLP